MGQHNFRFTSLSVLLLLALLHSVFYFFVHYRSLSLFLFLILFHLTQMRFCLETLTSIIRTGFPIPMELINLVKSAIIFISQMTLLRKLTFLLGSQIVILIVLLFWISFFLLTLVFVLPYLFLHWKILIMLLPQFPLTFHHSLNGVPCFNAQLMIILVLTGMVFVII